MPQQMRLFMEIKRCNKATGKEVFYERKRRKKRYFMKESGVFKTKRQFRYPNRLLYFLPPRPLNVFFPQHGALFLTSFLFMQGTITRRFLTQNKKKRI